MSTLNIKRALETELDTITPAITTAWENVDFTPPAVTIPFQVVNILFARPGNPIIGREFQESGYMQVKLMYPTKQGTRDAMLRAELLRSVFYRGRVLVSSYTYNWVDFYYSSVNVRVTIDRTPEITPGVIEDGRYTVIVRIPFFANLM